MLNFKFYGFGKTVRFIDKFFHAIGVVLSRLCLQPLFTVGVAWLIFKVFLSEVSTTSGFRTTFIVLAGLSLGYAFVATCYNIIVFVKQTPERKQNKKPVAVNMSDVATAMNTNEPVYYRVAQNPQYVVAEYPDRDELYFDDNGELVFVKMILKNKEENKSRNE